MKSNTAFIIIDVQIGIIADPDYPIYDAAKLLANIWSLIDKARASGTPVIYIQHTQRDEDVLGKGNPGWFIHPEIYPNEDDIIVMKKTPDSFHNTNLLEVLTELDVGQLVIAGLQTEYCIDTTCRRAFSLGYKTILVKDAHSTADSGSLSATQIITHHNQVLGSWFVSLANSEDIRF